MNWPPLPTLSILKMILSYLAIVVYFPHWRNRSASLVIHTLGSSLLWTFRNSMISSWRWGDQSLCHSRCGSEICLLSDIIIYFFPSNSLWLICLFDCQSASSWCFHGTFHHNPKISHFNDSGQLRDHPFIWRGRTYFTIGICPGLSKLNFVCCFIAQTLNHMRSFWCS